MKVLFFCSRWGHGNLCWEVFADRVKQAGYDGIETDIPVSAKERSALLRLLKDRGLALVAQHWETGNPDFNSHLAAYRERLTLAASMHPWCINAHTGRDFFTPVQNKILLEVAAGVSSKSGVPLYHETHRGRFSFAAHVTYGYLKEIQALELTLDVSHWINVAESYLEDQQKALALAIIRTRHIHARIGHPEAPQVPDPRAPEWGHAVARHLAIWDEVYAARLKAGAEALGITVEFGPFPYMPIRPYSQEPAVDLWEVNDYMKTFLQNRYCD